MRIVELIEHLNNVLKEKGNVEVWMDLAEEWATVDGVSAEINLDTQEEFVVLTCDE